MEILGRNQTMPKKGRLGFLKKWIACVLIRNKPHLITISALLTPYWVKWGSGGLRGGALWASARGLALSGGPADFLGLAVVYGAMFFGTVPHGFGRTYYTCIGALGPHMNRVPFCVISCKRWLRMRKIAFQRF